MCDPLLLECQTRSALFLRFGIHRNYWVSQHGCKNDVADANRHGETTQVLKDIPNGISVHGEQGHRYSINTCSSPVSSSFLRYMQCNFMISIQNGCCKLNASEAYLSLPSSHRTSSRRVYRPSKASECQEKHLANPVPISRKTCRYLANDRSSSMRTGARALLLEGSHAKCLGQHLVAFGVLLALLLVGLHEKTKHVQNFLAMYM